MPIQALSSLGNHNIDLTSILNWTESIEEVLVEYQTVSNIRMKYCEDRIILIRLFLTILVLITLSLEVLTMVMIDIVSHHMLHILLGVSLITSAIFLYIYQKGIIEKLILNKYSYKTLINTIQKELCKPMQTRSNVSEFIFYVKLEYDILDHTSLFGS